MKRNLALLIVAAAVAAGLAFWLFRRDPAQTAALGGRTQATRALTEYLVKTKAGRGVLVVSNPFIERGGVSGEIRATEAAGVRGIEQGLGGRLKMEGPVFPALKPEAEKDPRSVPIDPETTTPLGYLVAEDAFDRLAKAHPDCDVILSLIGLPAALPRVQCWQAAGPPRFALLLPDLRMIGNAEAVRGAVQRGKLAAFVLQKPPAPDAKAGAKPEAAADFERQFVLVTADNIDQVIQAYPKLFPGR
jgi:hypothetical protein